MATSAATKIAAPTGNRISMSCADMYGSLADPSVFCILVVMYVFECFVCLSCLLML
jgi:hypothetical protein